MLPRLVHCIMFSFFIIILILSLPLSHTLFLFHTLLVLRYPAGQFLIISYFIRDLFLCLVIAVCGNLHRVTILDHRSGVQCKLLPLGHGVLLLPCCVQSLSPSLSKCWNVSSLSLLDYLIAI